MNCCGYLAAGWVAGKCGFQRLRQAGSALKREGNRDQYPRGNGLIALACRHKAPAFHRVDRGLVEARGSAARAQLDRVRCAVRRYQYPQDCAALFAASARKGRVDRRRVVEIRRVEIGWGNRQRRHRTGRRRFGRGLRVIGSDRLERGRRRNVDHRHRNRRHPLGDRLRAGALGQRLGRLDRLLDLGGPDQADDDRRCVSHCVAHGRLAQQHGEQQRVEEDGGRQSDAARIDLECGTNCQHGQYLLSEVLAGFALRARGWLGWSVAECDSELRGQDQLSVLRDAQLILTSVMFDDDFAGATHDVFAAYASRRVL